MIRDVVVHMNNEQPMLADLEMAPSPSDVAVICRNVRGLNGKKPIFIDSMDSTFILPLVHIRFIEIPKSSIESAEAEEAGGDISGDWGAQEERSARGPESVERSLARLPANSDDPDSDLLRRIQDA